MRGVRADFDDFYRTTYPGVSARLIRMTRGVEDAHDIAQEAYARAWQSWPAVAACENPAGWIHTVAWRLAVNRARRLRTGRQVLGRVPLPADVPAPGVDRVLLMSALRRVSHTEREALVLHYYAGLPVSSIAERLGVPAGTVKARLSRGRTSLARLLGTLDKDAVLAS
jgi:RNA polymerase sigma-70 factor, ECF subfamily